MTSKTLHPIQANRDIQTSLL